MEMPSCRHTGIKPPSVAGIAWPSLLSAISSYKYGASTSDSVKPRQILKYNFAIVRTELHRKSCLTCSLIRTPHSLTHLFTLNGLHQRRHPLDPYPHSRQPIQHQHQECRRRRTLLPRRHRIRIHDIVYCGDNRVVCRRRNHCFVEVERHWVR